MKFNHKAFTLIELIITIAIIALIAAAVFVSVNPAQRIGDTKDAVRATDAVAIEKAIQKSIASAFTIPSGLDALTADTYYMVVTEGGSISGTHDCATIDEAITRVDVAADFKNYLGDVPIDSEATGDDTGYYIKRIGDSFFTGACNAYGDTYVPAYAYSRTITIDNAQVSSTVDLVNFPVLFSGTYAYLATTGNGGNVEDPDGYDIIFSSDAAGASQLDHEIESYSSSTGEVSMWVEIPILDYNDDTVIYMLYGNSDVSTSQESITGVWDSNYQAVWHLDETSGAHEDSTSNNNDSSNIDVTTQGSASGQINGADYFDGAADDINFGDVLELDFPITISTWVYPDANNDGLIQANDGNVVYAGYWMLISGSNSIELGFGDGEGTQAADRLSIYSSNNSVPASNWTYVASTIEGTSTADMNIYIDGVNDYGGTSGSATSYEKSDASPFVLGHRWLWANYLGGNMDEVRISNIARSNDWIGTEYSNQNSPAIFYSVSAEL